MPAPDQPLPPGYTLDQAGNAVLASGPSRDAADPDPTACLQTGIVRSGPNRDAAAEEATDHA
jgi:hypothetical protein